MGRIKAFLTSDSNYDYNNSAFLISTLWWLYSMDSRRSLIPWYRDIGARGKSNPFKVINLSWRHRVFR